MSTPEDIYDRIVAAMAVPQAGGALSSRLFVIGSLDQQVNIYSQQVRALNLATALAERQQLRGKKVAVIGAGIAGLTFAAAASRLGATVRLFECAPRILSTFRSNTTRWLHPHINNWPHCTEYPPTTNLPIMNWCAATADNVVEQLEKAYQLERNGVDPECNIHGLDIDDSGSKLELTWNHRPSGNEVKDDRDRFDIAVVCVGFGKESPSHGKTYWQNDDVDQASNQYQEKSRPTRWLISGTGDGGLADLLRLRLIDFSLLDVFERFLGSDTERSKIGEAVLHIERNPQSLYPEFLTDAYRKLEFPHVIERIHKALRVDTEVVLNANTNNYFGPNSSPLHRFLVSQLRHTGRGYAFHSKELQHITQKDGVYYAQWNSHGSSDDYYHEVIIRHGPKAVLTEFDHIAERLKEYSKTSKQRYQLLDFIRTRQWPPEYFNPSPEIQTGTSAQADSTPRDASGPLAESLEPAPPLDRNYSLCSLPERIFPENVRPVREFVGRKDEASRLHEWAHNPRSKHYSKTVCIIQASTGVGKSSVAWDLFKNAHREERWRGRMWWRVYENETFEPFLQQSFRYVSGNESAGADMDALERMEAVLNYLEKEPFLIVIDGFERAVTREKERVFNLETANVHAQYLIEKFLQLPNPKSRILLTTWISPPVGFRAVLEDRILRIPLKLLTMQEATRLYAKTCMKVKNLEYKSLLPEDKFPEDVWGHPVVVRCVAGLSDSAKQRFSEANTGGSCSTPVSFVVQHVLPTLSPASTYVLKVIAIFSKIVSQKLLTELMSRLSQEDESAMTSGQTAEAIERLVNANLLTREQQVQGAQLENLLFLHGVIAEAAWLSIPDTQRKAQATAVFRELVRMNRQFDAYDVLFGRLNEEGLELKYTQERVQLLDLLLDPQAGPDVESKAHYLIHAPSLDESHNKMAVVYASRAAAYLWHFKPASALPFLDAQVTRRRTDHYRGHEQKARAMRAYTHYLLGQLQVAYEEIVQIQQQYRYWEDSFGNDLKLWLEELFNKEGSQFFSSTEFSRRFVSWTAQETILARELLLRREIERAKQLYELEQLIDRCRKGQYRILLADVLMRALEYFPNSESKKHWLQELWGAATCSDESYWYRRAASFARARDNGTTLRPAYRGTKWARQEIADGLIRYAHPDIGELWVTWNPGRYDFCYGGARIVDANHSDDVVKRILERLLEGESGVKNLLINKGLALARKAPQQWDVPQHLLSSKVGPARCIVRLTKAVQGVLAPTGYELNPHEEIVDEIIRTIGSELNQQDGRVKLTPDFGGNSRLGELLFKITPHVLGVSATDGGSGGKSAFTNASALALFAHLGVPKADSLITVVGSEGALGRGIVEDLLEKEGEPGRLALCDLKVNPSEVVAAPPGGSEVIRLSAAKDVITEACLCRGGLLVICCYGEELERSPLAVIPAGTTVALCENLAFSDVWVRKTIESQLARQQVELLPSQLLTVGGAAVSRFEWFFREEMAGKPFDKNRGLAFVRDLTLLISKQIHEIVVDEQVQWHDAMDRWLAS